MRILVTGANGYIGSRLIPRLLEAGHFVRAMVRDARRLDAFTWRRDVEIVEGDVNDGPSLARCCTDMDAAYYLVHGMEAGKDFRSRDVAAAHQFGRAAAQIPHVIYLGGLQPEGQAADHLASRAEVGAALAEHAPVTEFRAGPVIGSGSASFEMTRYLAERLPIMVVPRWVDNAIQPIGINDVLAYLAGALDKGPQGIVDVGGDRMSFRSMMLGYAEARGLKRRIIKVPVLAPTLAARWVRFITPITNRLAVPLLAGIVHPVIADTRRAVALFPTIEPAPYRDTVRAAIARDDLIGHEAPPAGIIAGTYRTVDWENLKQETRTGHVPAAPADVHAFLSTLGGRTGWLAWQWAWRLRGRMDRAIGGPGLRSRPQRPGPLHVGDPVDFWRVEAIDPPRLLRFRAEMKVPGKAWLQFECLPDDGGTILVQTAFFEPRGLPGISYWNLLYPIHRLIFRDLLRAVQRRFA